MGRTNLSTTSNFRFRLRELAWRRGFVIRSGLLGAAYGTRSEEPARARKAKFASFVYHTTNVGDEIQTIAQLGFLPEKADIVGVDRDAPRQLSQRRIIIANGWYSHSAHPWPLPKNLAPILVSVHIAEPRILTPSAIRFLKDCGPVGCRDLHTLGILQDRGVDAYFSGCLTLTLNRGRRLKPKTTDRSEILVVDANQSDANYLPCTRDIFDRIIPEEIRRKCTTIEQEVKSHHRFDFRWKSVRALSLLVRYANAKLVITNRLHCALPCLALGTPVVFMHNRYDTDHRFDGLRSLLNGVGPDCEKLDYDWEDPKPRGDPTEISEALFANVQSSIARLCE